MSARKRVYIAGPITLGDRAANIRQAEQAFRELIEAGYAPLCPHLSCHVAWAEEVDHATWLAVELPWVATADAVLRSPGASAGADLETQYARRHGIAVYHSITDLVIREQGVAA